MKYNKEVSEDNHKGRTRKVQNDENEKEKNKKYTK